MKTVFAGYSPEGKPVTIRLDSMGRLWVEDTVTGACEQFNDEYYEPDFDFRFMLAHEGYRH